MSSKVIGIIGGMGPYAALDVSRKLHENTIAEYDKNHLNVISLSLCQEIPDRTEYLLGKTPQNPATILAKKISNYPMDVIGIACNTFHAPPIFNVLNAQLKSKNESIQILHLPNEVKKETLNTFKNATIGVLSSLGTFHSNIYQNAFKNSPLNLKFPNEFGRKAVHEALYNKAWGIKQKGALSLQAKQLIKTEVDKLVDVDAVLLACTELPLAINDIGFNTPVIDANLVLARALVKAVNPLKLKENSER